MKGTLGSCNLILVWDGKSFFFRGGVESFLDQWRGVKFLSDTEGEGGVECFFHASLANIFNKFCKKAWKNIPVWIWVYIKYELKGEYHFLCAQAGVWNVFRMWREVVISFHLSDQIFTIPFPPPLLNCQSLIWKKCL